MVSDKCKGRNLLNHLRQKNIEYNLSFEQILDKTSSYYYHWKCDFTFDGKTYSAVDKSKNLAVDNLLEGAESQIYSHLK